MMTVFVTVKYLRKLRLHTKLRLVICREKALVVGIDKIFVISKYIWHYSVDVTLFFSR